MIYDLLTFDASYLLTFIFMKQQQKWRNND